jgi:TIR domain
MSSDPYSWEFFLAHASPDLEIAERLYDLLTEVGASVFLDSKCIDLGEDWDQALVRAQKSSLITVVLVSGKTEKAYYEREEITTALELARSDEKLRVVPVFLGDEGKVAGRKLYGLQLKQGFVLENKKELPELAKRLLRLRSRLVGGPAPAPTSPKRRTWARWPVVGAAGVVAAAIAVLALYIFGAPEVQGDCLSVEHLSPNLIPHYLIPSFGSENFPYWFKLIARNDCAEDRFLVLRFEWGENVILPDAPQEIEFKVPHGQVKKQVFRPRFNLARQDITRMSIHWSIEDQDNKKKLDVSEIAPEIVAPYTIAWDLQKPKGPGEWEPVDRAYLLGSLEAWLLKPPPVARERGRRCRNPQGAGGSLIQERAIASCYQDLFFGDQRIPVAAAPIRFPARDRQRIRPHAEILGHQPPPTISSLEAALLLAAVLEAQRLDAVEPLPVLVVAPVEGTTGGKLKTAYLAWREAAQSWRALDMSRANQLDFSANVERGSARIARVLSLSSRIQELATGQAPRGAGFSTDESVAVVDFGNIPATDRIRPLPVVN